MVNVSKDCCASTSFVKMILGGANIDLQSAFDNCTAVSKSQLIVCNKQANRQVYSPKRMYGSQLGQVIFSHEYYIHKVVHYH